MPTRTTDRLLSPGLIARACTCLILLCALSSAPVRAERGTPGSLLIMPICENVAGRLTIINVTNTSSTDSVACIFVYVGPSGNPTNDCYEVRRRASLTPNDTFTIVAGDHNSLLTEGFASVHAVTNPGLEAVSFNHLIGSVTVIDGIQANSFALEAFSYRALQPEGTLTDLDGNDLQNLDGLEYEAAPDEILIPRFIGYSAVSPSELILINLTLTHRALVETSFTVYNDNEEVFSLAHHFKCWKRVHLDDIQFLFTNAFLQTTGHDPVEPYGAVNQESGWMRIDGTVAATVAGNVDDPAILAVLIEKWSNPGQAASLPFELGQQTNGALFEAGDTQSIAPGFGPPNPARTDAK